MNREARESFGAFVAARSGSLIRTAYVLTGDQHLAEDLLQKALARTAAKWRGVRDHPEAYVRSDVSRAPPGLEDGIKVGGVWLTG